MRKTRFILFNILKFILLTIIFYFLIYGVANYFVDEELFEDPTQLEILIGTLEQVLEEDVLFDEAFEGFPPLDHSAADNKSKLVQITRNQKQSEYYKERFNVICLKYKDYCKTIDFAGNFDNNIKYIYLSMGTRVMKYVQSHLMIGRDLMSVLKSINIKKLRGGRRAYSSWNKIVVNTEGIKTHPEKYYLLTHEMGHITDLGLIQGKSRFKNKLFTEFDKEVFAIDDPSLFYYKISRESEEVRKKNTNKKDFCSGYGMTDPFEDFAECFNLYLNHNEVFQYIAKRNIHLKKKFNFIAAIFDGKYMFPNTQGLDKFHNNADYRAWDTTRM